MRDIKFHLKHRFVKKTKMSRRDYLKCHCRKVLQRTFLHYHLITNKLCILIYNYFILSNKVYIIFLQTVK